MTMQDPPEQRDDELSADLREVIEASLTGRADWTAAQWQDAARQLAEALCDVRGALIAVQADRDGLQQQLRAEFRRQDSDAEVMRRRIAALPSKVLRLVRKEWAPQWTLPGDPDQWRRAGKLRMGRTSGLRPPGRPTEIDGRLFVEAIDRLKQRHGLASDAAALRVWQRDREPAASDARLRSEFNRLKTRLSRAREVLRNSLSG